MEQDIFAKAPGVYTYADTSLGKTAEGVLAAGKGERNAYDQRTVGGRHRGREDDGSHLIASRFQGSGRKRNLAAVHRNLNRGSYKRMENHLAKLLSVKKNIVHMKVAAAQRVGIDRPDVIMVTNALKNQHDKVDVEHLSFQNLSNKEQESIQAELNALGVFVDSRQREGLTAEQAALSDQYAQVYAEMPLGTAVYAEKGGEQMSKDQASAFHASLKEGAPSLAEQAAFAKARAASMENNNSGTKSATKTESGGFERGWDGGKRGGRDMGWSKSDKTNSYSSDTNVKLTSLDALFASRQQKFAESAKQTGKNTSAKAAKTGIFSSLMSSFHGRGSGSKSTSSSGKGFGAGKGSGGGKGVGGGKGSGGGKGFGGGAGKGGGIGR